MCLSARGAAVVRASVCGGMPRRHGKPARWRCPAKAAKPLPDQRVQTPVHAKIRIQGSVLLNRREFLFSTLGTVTAAGLRAGAQAGPLPMGLNSYCLRALNWSDAQL